MENVQDILGDNLIGSLGTLNEDGSPWVTPLHIFADNEAVYWFSKDTHQHSKNIERDGRVSVSLWSQAGGTRGAYISGTATKLSADALPEALEIVVSAVGKVPPVFEHTSGYRLPLGTPDTDRSSEKRWYFYS
jgi:nitroimidazol reductase NimA-like FMN-containing flavoprotein (pyridoxamine 5'-phosphate oxidase superfamily)